MSSYYDQYLTAEQCRILNPHPLAAKLQRMSKEQYKALRDDVARVGVRQPIVIDVRERCIIEGVHRARAGAETGRGAPAIYYMAARDGKVRDFLRRANLTRRHQNASSLAWTCAKSYEGKLGDNQHTKQEAVQICTSSLPVSLRSFRSAVCARDRGGPELRRALDGEELPVSLAERLVKDWPSIADQETIIREARESKSASTFATKIQKVVDTWRNRERVKHNHEIDPLGEKADAVLLDPAWQYPHDDAESGNPRSVNAHFPTMSTDEICEYLCNVRLAKDAAAFMWSTEWHLYHGDARKVLESLGLRYYGTIIWDKVTIGLGNVIRHRHEPLIVAVKGRVILTRPPEMITSIYCERRSSKHSEKPELYPLIDSMLPAEARRVEFFNRGGAPAPWMVFGNESGTP